MKELNTNIAGLSALMVLASASANETPLSVVVIRT
jgi:hypothetical protein